MSSFPGSPRVLKGSIVIMDPDTTRVERTITFQYNPEKMTRSLQPKYSSAENEQAANPFDFKGPPSETITLVAEIDATDDMELGEGRKSDNGILPQLAALETMIYPSSDQLRSDDQILSSGTMRISNLKGSLCLFVWNRDRIVPVKISSLNVEEQAFDPYLNPIRASVTLTMNVLSLNDLKMSSKAGQLYLLYQQGKEALSKKNVGSASLGAGVRP